MYVVMIYTLAVSHHKTLKGAKEYVRKKYKLVDYERINSMTLEYCQTLDRGSYVYIQRVDLKP